MVHAVRRFVVFLAMAVASWPALATAQVPEKNPQGVTMQAPGSARRCQEIEVILDMDAQPGGGTDYVSVGGLGVRSAHAYCTKAGYPLVPTIATMSSAGCTTGEDTTPIAGPFMPSSS